MVDIHSDRYTFTTLLDKSQFSDPDGEAAQAGISSTQWPLFGQLWPIGLLLAKNLQPSALTGQKILEIGCGLALPSLVLKRAGLDVTASDYHHLSKTFLQKNCEQNGIADIPFLLLDWQETYPGLGKFDFIMASDILYDGGLPHFAARFLSRHLTQSGHALIYDPCRDHVKEFIDELSLLGLRADVENYLAKDGSEPRKARFISVKW